MPVMTTRLLMIHTSKQANGPACRLAFADISPAMDFFGER
jgi:hypothetical protein